MLIRSYRSLRFLLRRVRAVVVTGVVVFGSSGVVHAQASAPVRSDQDILIQLEHDWDAAFHRHDAAFIDRILADEFIVTYDNGVRADRTLHDQADVGTIRKRGHDQIAGFDTRRAPSEDHVS